MTLAKSKNMQSNFMQLDPYSTQKVTFDFYFPSAGTFQHFPSNVSLIDG
jgi:hypothetical protein